MTSDTLLREFSSRFLAASTRTRCVFDDAVAGGLAKAPLQRAPPHRVAVGQRLDRDLLRIAALDVFLHRAHRLVGMRLLPHEHGEGQLALRLQSSWKYLAHQMAVSRSA